MKKMIFTFLMLLGVFPFASEFPSTEFMSIEEQEQRVSDIAKQLRRDHWVRGYEDVSSSETFVNRVWLDNYMSQPNMYETFFEDEEITSIEKCFESLECELYYVSVASSYMSGYGIEGTFILLYTKSGRHFKISHTVYAE